MGVVVRKAPFVNIFRNHHCIYMCFIAMLEIVLSVRDIIRPALCFLSVQHLYYYENSVYAKNNIS